ncbi:conserved exported hypothetical protein [Candidatus Terasakiella magnetica]|nr:conserved exported hypothetical protein [Candidatus Terasakiella magnetica]
MKYRWLIAVPCLFAFAPAWAEPVGYRYEIMWGGFHAGDMAITRDEEGGKARTGMVMRTVGLFDRFLRLRFSAESDSRPVPAPALLGSDRYETRFSNRHQERLMRVMFGPDGDPQSVSDDVVAVFGPPPEDDEPNPPVPPDLRHGTRDPLTNIALVGRHASAFLAGGPAVVRTASFDGKRLYDFEIAFQGSTRINIRGQNRDAIALTMTLRPRAGFKPRFLHLWEGAEYKVHLDPKTLLPIRIQSDSFTAAVVMNALGPCRVPAEQCTSELTAQAE